MPNKRCNECAPDNPILRYFIYFSQKVAFYLLIEKWFIVVPKYYVYYKHTNKHNIKTLVNIETLVCADILCTCPSDKIIVFQIR